MQWKSRRLGRVRPKRRLSASYRTGFCPVRADAGFPALKGLPGEVFETHENRVDRLPFRGRRRGFFMGRRYIEIQPKALAMELMSMMAAKIGHR